MSEVLSQAEIESLLAGMTAPEERRVPAEERPVTSFATTTTVRSDSKVVLPLSKRRAAAVMGRVGTVAYEPYDFRRSDKLSKEHIRTLQVIHDSFSRLFTSSISGYLRSTIQVDLISIEQVTYEEYVRSISASLINIVNVSPLSGQLLFDIDMKLMFAMLDRVLGGTGQGSYKPGKDLTDVEKVLTNNITRRALNELEAAWNDFLPLEFSVASVETSGQFVQIIPGNDTIVLVLFDISMGEQRGAIGIGIPYMLLKPVAQRLHTQRWFSSERKISTRLAPQMAARLSDQTYIPCIAQLGVSEVSVDTIAHLEVGHILPLAIAKPDNETGSGATAGIANVDVLIGNKPKFRGHIGLRGGKRLAVQIDEIIAPPPVLQVHRGNEAN